MISVLQGHHVLILPSIFLFALKFIFIICNYNIQMPFDLIAAKFQLCHIYYYSEQSPLLILNRSRVPYHTKLSLHTRASD